MAFGTRVALDPVREIAFGDVGATYSPVGTPLGDHARLIRFVSTLDAEVYLSLDGSTDQIRLAANSFFLLDLSANKVRDDGLFLGVGTQIYIQRVSGAPTSGNAWIEVMYAEGGK